MNRNYYQGKGFVQVRQMCSKCRKRQVVVAVLPEDLDENGKPRARVRKLCHYCRGKDQDHQPIPTPEQIPSASAMRKKHVAVVGKQVATIKPGDPRFEEIAATIREPAPRKRPSYKDTYYPGGAK